MIASQVIQIRILYSVLYIKPSGVTELAAGITHTLFELGLEVEKLARRLDPTSRDDTSGEG
jgi:hypothetical protein